MATQYEVNWLLLSLIERCLIQLRRSTRSHDWDGDMPLILKDIETLRKEIDAMPRRDG